MTVLVTGAGLIGRHVASSLVEQGTDVVVVDRRELPAGSLPSSVRLDVGDINDPEFMRDVIARNGVSEVVHTAALLAVNAHDNPGQAVTTNILGAVQLLDLARQGSLRRVVLASSGSINQAVYGRALTGGIVEDFENRVLSEGPTSFYIATKLSMEYFCQLYRRHYNVSAVALRLGAVLGAASWNDASLIARLGLSVLEAAREKKPLAITDQRFLWENKEEFLDPRDAAQGLVAAVFAPTLAQSVYNIAPSYAVSFDEFLAEAREAFPGLVTTQPVQPKDGLVGFPHARNAPTDISAAERDLGFLPRYRLRDAFAYMDRQLPQT